ncbi:proline--tRNA ligase [Pseudomonas frederiksbergensis]|uniref:Proline--tRNA ligase n=1 Tax=Pseudomonas frederiksbergensis TaxID=104087 RepID=A0A1J0EE74_9PSED|nr:proline--tRNA ligase [Pseudomonas frederiksbergensis]APC14353.1 proline--tRNA ligase [Pseudomonas frederiksbergensis]
MKNAISPTRNENFSEWYQQVINQAELAENSPVRGCMVIRPWGYGIWEQIQRELDQKFKDSGHANAYFPLLIPLSFLQKEAEHVDGFAKECAVVTHHRLEQSANGKLIPAGELEEPLIIRPTSETVIGASFSRWVQSYRDLPLLINQWANVLRWEMRPRIFLRTSEFLWQEGHTVHASKAEALDETLKMLDIYERFTIDYLAIPVIKGEKCSWERFPGAVNTYTIEAMMQDGKALQAGTSHFLGQNFAQASDIRFVNKDGIKELAWTTSWGVSTRLIGAMIMAHGDDDGLVIPPLVAPTQVIIVPIVRNEQDAEAIYAYCDDLKKKISRKKIKGQYLRISIDKREMNSGEKKWYHIKRGVPVRVEVGIKELEQNMVSYSCRDNTKSILKIDSGAFIKEIQRTLLTIQKSMLNSAKSKLSAHTKTVTSLKDFKSAFQRKDKLNAFILAPFIEDKEVEKAIGEFGVTVRCIPLIQPKATATCLFTGKPTNTWALYAKSY